MQELAALGARASVCTDCRLSDTRTNVVFGVGRSDADVMMVGEAPGRNEDLEGEPFVGAAGHLLNRLLAEVAEDRLVLLSTHIVEDISVLCPRVAILTGGRIVADTTPRGARSRLEGAIFEGAVDKHEMEALADRFEITQAVLIEGRNRVRVHAPDGPPPDGFESVAPSLEDAYLLLTRNGAARDGERPPETPES